MINIKYPPAVGCFFRWNKRSTHEHIHKTWNKTWACVLRFDEGQGTRPTHTSSGSVREHFSSLYEIKSENREISGLGLGLGLPC